MLTARAGLPPFVVTLATFYLLQGIAFMISTTPKGQVTTVLSNFALERVGPLPVALAALADRDRRSSAGCCAGRRSAATSTPSAATRGARARTACPSRARWCSAYVLCGMLAAGAGVILAARATVGSPTAGQGLELSAITVVVIGGTSLLGGRGTLLGTLGGVRAARADRELVHAAAAATSTLTDLIRGVVILAAAAIFVRRAGR